MREVLRITIGVAAIVAILFTLKQCNDDEDRYPHCDIAEAQGTCVIELAR